jgi:hypothetical protein
MGLGLSLVILEAVDVYMIKDEDEPEPADSVGGIEVLPIFGPTRGGGYAGARVTF